MQADSRWSQRMAKHLLCFIVVIGGANNTAFATTPPSHFTRGPTVTPTISLPVAIKLQMLAPKICNGDPEIVEAWMKREGLTDDEQLLFSGFCHVYVRGVSDGLGTAIQVVR